MLEENFKKYISIPIKFRNGLEFLEKVPDSFIYSIDTNDESKQKQITIFVLKPPSVTKNSMETYFFLKTLDVITSKWHTPV